MDFKCFESIDFEKTIDIFFKKILKKLEEENIGELNDKIIENIKRSKFKFLNKREVYSNIDGKEKLTGYLYNIKYYFKDEEKDSYENILILIPDKDGYFYSANRRLYSPFVIFDKFEREDMENDKKYLDLSNAIIMQGYYLAVLSTFFRIVNSVERKRKKNIKETGVKGNYINELSKTIGVKYYKYYLSKNEKYIYQKIPIFFEPDELNYIEYYTNPRKVVYPNEKVNEFMRLPHESHGGIVDFLETPESEKIGLTLSLVYDDLTYDFEKLNFNKSKNILSFATSQIPFILHSDGARILMGSKNLKQAIKLNNAEKPIIFTGNELDNIGINALVVYGLFKGFNFEDGIVVSESFAKKMETDVLEEEKYTLEVKEDKHPEKKGNKWIYKRNKNDIQEIVWKVNEGDWVSYKDKIMEIYDNKKLIKTIYYNGKYDAQVKNIPDFPELPYENYEKDSKRMIDIRIEFLVKKPLEVGDKIMGRHGNKGTISLIVPDDEMPKVVINNNEYPVEVILSPLGVVSRMNIGQLYEVHFSMAKKFGDFRDFDNGVDSFKNGFEYKDKLLKELKKLGSDNYGRFKVLYNNNEWYLTSGFQYLVRLDHCVRDKIHVVSFAREGEINWQPLKGKSRQGGQRFGEMEFWSIYSYNNKRLAKLFAKKNLDKHTKKEFHKYPEEHFKKILKYFNIYLYTPEYMKSKFEFKDNIKELFKDDNIEEYIYDFMYEGFKNAYVKFVMNNLGLFKKSYENFKKDAPNLPNSKNDSIFDNEYKYFIIDNNKLSKSIEYFENDNNKKIESALKNYLFKKDGYLRNLVIARRLHFSGRTVITPQPLNYIEEYDLKVDIDTVILPIEFGVEWLKEFKYDNYDLRSALKGNKKKRIEIAKLLNKYIENEELYVILNRQPSLHRHSIQSFIPRFWHNYTIGLPINVCEGFNADFDGDTMAVYFPNIDLDKDIKDELKKMLPSRNAFKLGDGELLYSIDQDMVYGRYLTTGKNKKEIKKYYSEIIRKYIINEDYDSIKRIINEEIIGKDVKLATEKNLTLSIFEIINDAESMQDIKKSKCRGNDKQFNQLNISVEDFGKGFVHGLKVEEYFDVNKGIAKRARRTLMDKKLKVADAGYFTRKLVEFLGTLVVGDFEEYEEIEINLDKSFDENNKIKDVFGKDRFLYRYVKINNKILFITPENIDILPDKFILLSPKIKEKKNMYFVSKKYLGYDVSKLKDFDLNEYIGISSGHVLGERGTQLSMETFHSGSKGINMQNVSSLIFNSAFNSNTYMEFLISVEDKFHMELNKDNVKQNNSREFIFNKLNSKSIYFELLYLFAQYLKNNKNIESVNKYFNNIDLRGPLTCMTFEKGLDVMKNLEEGKLYNETHPRIEYAFFWRDINE
ncbi:hypothetical protein [Marinitoga sp. 38H-ov]|uniref:hypothetical protein n=1 Tax=Marinitoga sp. 38H-ov TaxID=1755814 RepID=UPI0013EAC6A4|nr:hypothetical protein [Marinitoga sp. 38H-ov]KAF2956651.1 hypothetical protein AS160_04455 [Marinitoga sp. 38H-ov]